MTCTIYSRSGDLRFRREDFAAHLQQGFPWHLPHQPHIEIRTPDDWWTMIHSTIARAFMAGGGFTRTEADVLTLAVRDEYTNPLCWRVFPDAEPTLRLLTDRGWKHVVVSNHVPELAQLVDALGLGGHFEAIHTSAASGYEKPHPKAFLSALPQGADVQGTVMVGDSMEADVRGAEAVGIRAFLVRKPDPRRECRVFHLAHLAAALCET
jgi:putative hydrolase of the HAD superfamily